MLKYPRCYRMFALTLIITLISTLIPSSVWGRMANSEIVNERITPGVWANQSASQTQMPDFAQAQIRPSAHSSPLVVSQVQSSYLPGQPITVTFTVQNSLPPGLPLDIPEAGTLTDTMTALDRAYLQPDDPHTVQHVLLVTQLTEQASFVSASRTPDQANQGNEYSWNLGTIPPRGVVTVSLVVASPANVSQRVALDSGMTAWGTYQTEMVEASACPIMVQPSSDGTQNLAQYLQPSAEANFADPYLAKPLAQHCPDPLTAFEYVQDLQYEAYKGSLRGARGTEWSQAGNSLDQASLLIALLRGQGTPARYRQGNLTIDQARELIRSMFPTTGAVVGYTAPEAEMADPLNDPQLLAEAQAHWWVEAYINGSWQALDPTFQHTIPGQTMTSSVGEPLAEPPSEQQHTVTVSLETEFYQQLSYLNGGFEYEFPISHTFTTVELVGEPLTLEHLVATENSNACLFFCWTRYTYVPYLRLGDNETILQGGQFFELLSNFPLGQFAITAEWLHFDLRDVEGQVTRYTRQLADRLKAGPRTGELRKPKKIQGLLTADVMSSLGPGLPPLVNELDSHTIYLTPSWMPVSYAANVGQEMLITMPKIATVHSMNFGIGDIEGILAGHRPRNLGMVELAEATETMVGFMQANNRLIGASYVTLSDQSSQNLAETALVRAYPDAPRITIVSSIIQQPSHQVAVNDSESPLPFGDTTGSATGSATMNQILDLLHDNVRVVAYPGQAKFAEKVYRMTRGMNDTFLESAVGESLSVLAQGGEIRSAANILQAAESQGIELIYLDNDHLENFTRLEISSQAETFIREAVANGYGVFVPQRMVAWSDDEAIAWWELDLETGEMIGVGENGTHQFLVINAIGALIFVNIVMTLINITKLVARYHVWRHTAEMTWDYFWQDALTEAQSEAGEALTQETAQDLYKNALLKTKQHMRDTVWPLFSQVWDDSALGWIPAEAVQ